MILCDKQKNAQLYFACVHDKLLAMNYKKTVAEAWAFTQQNKPFVVWYGAIPAFFTTLVGIGYLAYQYYAFRSSSIFENWEESFTSILMNRFLGVLEAQPGLFWPLVVTAIVVALGYFILPVFAQGAVIQLITRKRNGQKVRVRNGISLGMLSFLPLFEYHLLIKAFSIWSVIFTLGMAVRNLGMSSLSVLLPVFAVTLIIAAIIAVIFTYVEYYIVIDEEGVFASIGKSVHLVVKHLEHTLFLMLLMLLIFARIVVQLIFVLLLPFAVLALLYLFVSANIPSMISVGLGALVGGIGLIFASYLTGMVQVFAVSVWTFTFLQLTGDDLPSARQAVKNESEANEN